MVKVLKKNRIRKIFCYFFMKDILKHVTIMILFFGVFFSIREGNAGKFAITQLTNLIYLFSMLLYWHEVSVLDILR